MQSCVLEQGLLREKQAHLRVRCLLTALVISNKNLVISKQSVNFNSAAKHRDQPWRLS